MVAIKAVHVIPNLLLQKLNKSLKTQDHIKALLRRLNLWKKGEICELVREVEAIMGRLSTTKGNKNISQISRQFSTLMDKRGALKLLTNNMSIGILPLDQQTLNLLHQKHPDAQEADELIIMTGDVPEVHPILCEGIDENMIKQAAIRTKAWSGRSCMDVDGWR